MTVEEAEAALNALKAERATLIKEQERIARRIADIGGGWSGLWRAAEQALVRARAEANDAALPRVRARSSTFADWGEFCIVANGPRRATLRRPGEARKHQVPGYLTVHSEDQHLLKCLKEQ